MSPKLVRWTRLSLFLAIAAFLLGGPFAVQVLGKRTRWLRGWQMYGSRAGDWCFVHYHRYEGGGGRAALSRFETLGIAIGSPDWWHEREIRTIEQARSEGKRMCAELGAGTKLGFAMRCGARGRSWKVLTEDSGDVCGN